MHHDRARPPRRQGVKNSGCRSKIAYRLVATNQRRDCCNPKLDTCRSEEQLNAGCGV